MKFYHLVFLGTILQPITLVIAIKNFYKYKKSSEKFFLYFIAYTFLTELVAIISWAVLGKNPTILHNIFINISFLFYFYWYYTILTSKKQKKIVLLLSAVFLIVGVYNFFTLKHNDFQAPTFVLGALINVVTSLLFFSQLLNDKAEIEVKHNLKFWIATGLLLFNSGMVPLMLFSEQFNAHNNIRTVILVVLNFILYTCYSLGFILCKKKVEK